MQPVKSTSREFLLGLLVLVILGAWSASAQVKDANGSETNVTPLSFGTADSYAKLQKLTFWTNLRLHAAAMSNPSNLRGKVVGRTATVEELVQWVETRGGSASDLSLASVKVGFIDSDSQFVAFEQQSCDLPDSCMQAVLLGVFGAYESDPGAVISLNNYAPAGNDNLVLAKEAVVFWSANEGEERELGTKALLVK